MKITQSDISKQQLLVSNLQTKSDKRFNVSNLSLEDELIDAKEKLERLILFKEYDIDAYKGYYIFHIVCSNCKEGIRIPIYRGERVTVFITKNEIECKNCGCKIMI
ncbi:MAG: hypothetical protein KAS32_22495 [Candidatus Peribacteraceae bacterium]|nr:hypothetical protein [Candidatus Peribacteraceae bacterium]